jgi:ribosomal protein L31
MTLQKKIKLGLVFCLFSATLQADHLPIGMEVLADCHSFFSKGKIKRLHKERYVVHFYKDSRPVLCTPFAWDSMFLVPYKSVAQYTTSGDEVFKTGDLLKITFRATARGAFFSHKFSITAAIKEINENGAAQLEITEGEIEAQQLFARWVGTNYVPLDFSKDLTADKLTIQKINKQ